MADPERLLVVVAGLPGSGKTTLTRNLSEEYGFQSRNIGDELARLYREEHGLPVTAPVSGSERMPMHKQIRRTDPGYFERFCIDGDYERRTIDGLRNLSDAKAVTRVGGFVVTLEAPLPLRLARRAHDVTKDADADAMIRREQAEMNDPDPHGAQATAVMGLARHYGFYVDGSQHPEKILEDTVAGFLKIGIEL